MCRRDWNNLTQSQLEELSQLHALRHALCFVSHQQSGFTQPTKVLRNVMVLRRNARTCVYNKHHDIRFRNGLPCLLGHFLENAGVGVRLEAPRINNNVFVLTLLAMPIMSVTSQPREISDDCIAGFCKSVKKSGFADVGPTD